MALARAWYCGSTHIRLLDQQLQLVRTPSDILRSMRKLFRADLQLPINILH